MILSWKGGLIKDYMSGKVGLIGDRIQAFVSGILVTKENAWLGSVLKLVMTIRTQQRVTQTSKDSHSFVIRRLIVQFFIRREILDSGCRKPIDNINGSKE